jgi:hypothetical protein
LKKLCRVATTWTKRILLWSGSAFFIASGFVSVASKGSKKKAIARRIRGLGVEVAIRKSRGMDIAAACGQLRVERLRRRPPVGTEEDREIEVA